MLAVTVVPSAVSSDRPPVILVHGAANSSAVWRFWQESLASQGWSSHAVDLRGHGKSLGSVDGLSMSDYADDIESIANGLSETPVVMGWSMGGLVAIMVAARGLARACIGLAPSTPSVKRDDSVLIRRGVFGPEEYGITSDDPSEQPVMPDLDTEERLIALGSGFVRIENCSGRPQSGDCGQTNVLPATGSDRERRPELATFGLCRLAPTCGVSGVTRFIHWGLVLNRRLLPNLSSAVLDWLAANTT